MSDFVVITPIVLSVFATGFSFFQWYSGRGQRDATEADTLTGAALNTVKLMQGSINDLEQKTAALTLENASLKASIGQLTKEIKEYHDGTHILITQLVDAQLKPQWLPPEVRE